MSTDRSLAALLRALQSPSHEPDNGRVLESSAGLLSLLSNPANVTILVSQLLAAPGLWHGTSSLRMTFQLLRMFATTCMHLAQRDRESLEGKTTLYHREGLPIEEWVKSVVKGADDKSPRWKHLVVLGGILIGFEKQELPVLPLDIRQSLEAAVVTATNLALEDESRSGPEGLHAACLVLGSVFELLSGVEKARLNSTRLLPLLIDTIFFSKDGLHWGYLVGMMDADLVQGSQNKFHWSPKSTSYYQAQRMASSPLVTSLGPLSGVVGYCIATVPQVELIFHAADSLQRFSRSISVQWKQNKLSELDPSEESQFLHEETLSQTIPTLWQLLRSSLFTTVIIQSALIGRMLGDGRIPPPKQPLLAIQTLHTLRNLYFITSRVGERLFSQHTFVYTGSIDILSRFPAQAEAFLQEIKPSSFGRIPEHPYARLLDLFFLNTAENFTLELSPATNRDLLLGAAAAYSGAGHDARLLDIFEAAHSVTLAVFAAPQNHALSIAALPDYLDTLFHVFPAGLSARQFRLAIRTLVHLTSAPGPIASAQPLLGPTIMELVRARVYGASAVLLPPLARPQPGAAEELPLSEQAALVLALIDALPALAPAALDEWLPLTADAMNSVEDGALRATCRHRFWEVLQGGEMDVARAQRCVTWWTTRGGHAMVVAGQPSGLGAGFAEPAPEEAPMMSGALHGAREEKL